MSLDYEKIAKHLIDNYNITPLEFDLENLYTDDYCVFKHGVILYEIEGKKKIMTLQRYHTTEDVIKKIDEIKKKEETNE